MWEPVRRFGMLVFLCMVAGTAAASLLSYGGSPSYSANAYYVVPPGGPAQGAGDSVTPFDAERFARTYAVVLATDEQLLDSLGGQVGRSRTSLADRIRTVALPNSSAIRVTYKGSSRDEVRRFFATLTQLVQQPAPPTPNLRPDTLRLLQAPDDIAKTGGGTWVAPLAGALAGLLVGLAGATLLTNALPKVRSADDARELGGPSVVEVDVADDDSVAALAVRALDHDGDGVQGVAVVALTRRGHDHALALVDRLAAATRSLVAQGRLSPAAEAVTWTPADLGVGQGERAAQDADRTVVVVATGTSVADLGTRLSALVDLGVTEQIIAVVRQRRPAVRRRQVDSAPEAAAHEAATTDNEAASQGGIGTLRRPDSS
jgi:hypothetical protein